MREMRLADYLSTDLGRFEARLQLITFGTGCRQSCDAASDQEMLCSAVGFGRRQNVILAPSECSHAALRVIAKRLSFRPGPLGRMNANPPELRAAHSTEFSQVIGLVNSINASERALYDYVCRSFSERQAKRNLSWREPRARRWDEPFASGLSAGS
jgi:hypothetical protein